MCIQQPQDSSQRSAVTAHYNQSSQAHVSSFRIKTGGKKPNQPPPDTSAALHPAQISARGGKWGALCRGLQSSGARKWWQVKVLTWGLYGTCAARISVVFSRGRSGRSKMLGNRSTGEEGRSWTEGMEQRCQASVLDRRWQKGWGYRLRNMHYRRLEKGWRYSSAKAVAALSLGAPQANKLWDAPHQMTGEEPSRELQSCQYAALKSFQTHQVP